MNAVTHTGSLTKFMKDASDKNSGKQEANVSRARANRLSAQFFGVQQEVSESHGR